MKRGERNESKTMIRSINCYVCFYKRANGWDKLKNAKANRLDRRKDVNKLFPSPLFERKLAVFTGKQIGPISPTIKHSSTKE